MNRTKKMFSNLQWKTVTYTLENKTTELNYASILAHTHTKMDENKHLLFLIKNKTVNLGRSNILNIIIY